MALTYSVTLLEDHHGVAKHQVKGHEYYADLVVDITSYEAGGVPIDADFLTASGFRSISAMIHTGGESGRTVVFTHAPVSNNVAAYSALQIYESGVEHAGSGTDLGEYRLRVYGLI